MGIHISLSLQIFSQDPGGFTEFATRISPYKRARFQLQGIQCAELSTAFSKLTQLRDLYLELGNIENRNYTSLKNAISKLPHLTTLEVRQTPRNYPAAPEEASGVADGAKSARGLTAIKMSHSQIKDNGFRCFMNNVSSWPNLGYLEFDCNQLSDGSLTSLINALPKMPKLGRVSLLGHSFSEAMKQRAIAAGQARTQKVNIMF